MKQEFTRIAVKVGSNVLARRDGTLDVTRMSALVDQIAELNKSGVEIILISSGAVASGRSEIHPQKKLDSVDQRQLFSAVGQAKLINRYYELFREHGIAVGQVLTTKENFSTRRHYLNQKNCMTVMLENGVIPIVNENDTISVSELMFTDNDELSGLIASMMDAQALIILSNIDGILQRFTLRSCLRCHSGDRAWKGFIQLYPGYQIEFRSWRYADENEYRPQGSRRRDYSHYRQRKTG